MTGTFSKLAIVVPTRNRPLLAANAVASLRCLDPAVTTVIVSDNSTGEPDRTTLETACRRLDLPALRYIRPPLPMGMTAHWSWVMQEVLADSDVSHVSFLTDRMVFKPDVLAELVGLCSARASEILTYDLDRVEDEGQPVLLVQKEWTDQLLRIHSSHLLRLAARGVSAHCLPQMFNTIVPRDVLERVEHRYGSIFDSISPDLCFAYRCLDVVASVTYWDRAPLIAYAANVSHGGSYSRGRLSPARIDFMRELGATQMNASAPVPELPTASNAVFNEYAFVRVASGGRLPPIDRRAYLAIAARETDRLEDPQTRARTRALLRAHGWSAGQQAVYHLSRVRDEVRFFARHPRCLLDRLAFRAWSRHRAFSTTHAALETGKREPRPRSARLGHLRRILGDSDAWTSEVRTGTRCVVGSQATPSLSEPR